MLRIAAAAAAIALSASCRGESLYAVRGEVKDLSGAPVPDAIVGTIGGCDSKEGMWPAVITDGAGRFGMIFVGPGGRELRIAKDGFRAQCFAMPKKDHVCADDKYKEDVPCAVVHVVLEAR